MPRNKYDRYDAAIDIICTMQKVEDNWYYKPLNEAQRDGQELGSENDEKENENQGKMDDSEKPVDPNFRNNMAKWYFEIAKHCDFQHETVAIAIYCLDRFLLVQPDVLLDPFMSGLLGMTVLYTCVKTNEDDPLVLSQLSEMSDNLYAAEDFEEMEFFVLSELKWRVHPPTAIAYVRQILCKDNRIMTKPFITRRKDRELLLDIATTQIQMALCDDFFVSVKPKNVAYGALMNAFETLHQSSEGKKDDGDSYDVTDDMQKVLLIILGLDEKYKMESQRERLWDIQKRLYLLTVDLTTEEEYEEEDTDDRHIESEDTKGNSEFLPPCDDSPRTVCKSLER